MVRSLGADFKALTRVKNAHCCAYAKILAFQNMPSLRLVLVFSMLASFLATVLLGRNVSTNELGEFSFEYHREIVIYALKTTINKIIFCGNLYSKVLNKINYNTEQVLHLSSELEIIKFLEKNTHNNDIILAKGSNSTNINTLVKMLLKTKKDN